MSELKKSIPRNLHRTPCADKNDKLGWQDGFSVDFQGLVLGMRTNDPSLISKLRGMLPADASPSEQREVDILLSLVVGGKTERRGVKNFHIVYDGWSRLARTLELEEALGMLEEHARLSLATFSRELVYVKSSLVGWNRKAILVCGDLGVGTSTLVNTLCENGGVVYSETFAAIDDAGWLRSYEHPEFPPLSPGLILCSRYEADRTWKPKKLTPAQTALELIGRSPGAFIDPMRVLKRLTTLASTSTAYRGRRGNADKLVSFVKKHLL